MSTLLGTVSDLLSHLIGKQTRNATPVVPSVECPDGLRIPAGNASGYTIVSDPALVSSPFQRSYAESGVLGGDVDLITASAAQGVAGACCRAIYVGAAGNLVIAPERLGDVDTVNVVNAPAASDLATAITRLVGIATAYAAHRILVTGQVHKAADSVNAVTATVPTVPDEEATPEEIAAALAAAILYANDIRTQYEAHRVYTTSHNVADAGSAITEPVASDEATLIALTNDLANKYGMHQIKRDGVHAFNDVTLYAIPVGTVIPLSARIIRATGSTAQKLTVLW